MQAIVPSHATGGVAQIALRVPVALRDALKTEARRQGRSLNTHVSMILRAAAGGQIGVEAPAAQTNMQEGQEAN